MWKPMLSTLVEYPPIADNWLYEVKYDGFRCGLEWEKNTVKLWSRNGNELTASFPEIVAWCKKNQHLVEDQLPLLLDGEIVVLHTEFTSLFSFVQQRGRLKSKDKIKVASQKRPASLMVFDMIQLKGNALESKTLKERRKQLEIIARKLKIAKYDLNSRINLVQSFKALDEIMATVMLHQCEGIIAKKKSSTYLSGKRTSNWFKVKNYRIIQGIISGWNIDNDYFDLKVFHHDQIETLGKVKNGFSDDDKKTLTAFIQENGKKINGFSWEVTPSVCLDINCLEAKDGELREPSFRKFRFDLSPEDCTMNSVQIGLAQLPEEIEISKPEKLLFPEVSKQDYLLYLRFIAPFILPKLKNKRLSMIRYPDGIEKHSFYQKHLPDYAPNFIQTVNGEDNDEDILCNDLRSLLWFGNHASLEFHIPFHTINSDYPDEIVFDLDPPTLSEFPLAVTAAQLIKEMLEHQGFIPFVKTSGRTGLQVHIPLQPKSMSFTETRIFMETVATVLVDNYPQLFTVERLKKNRGNRLYIDYVQHALGKTIIAAYSPRATNKATIATPLYWNEVNEQLDPQAFTMKTIPKRLLEIGCPWE
ncbi:DNA ligase D [Paraliobacillus sp. X-1268]|uniref:DNA ligase D n=1 Tax=Paraliobacillus sp. X-1268 TaxID=2213193 RepID=UPI0013003EBD|nr:DNA ligase D [Paraliobacillus sp. X-1268]